MNGSSQLPQYTFDPVTQRYTLLNPKAQAGLGPLYEATGAGGAVSSPMGPGPSMTSPGMAQLGVGFQNAGLTLSGIPGVTTGIAGALASAIGNSMMGSQVSPVANPSMPTETAIAPTDTLAAMNAAVAAQQAEASNQAAVANTAEATADAVGAAADAGAAAAADAGAAADGGGAGGADGGAGGADSGGGDGGGGAGVGDGERAGGMISLNKYAEGGLASAAKHIQSQGRGDDSVLVHMTPGEVRGLQAIAMQHGGALTINPETGLVEAGFLKNILPMIAGAALAATGVGAPMAAMMVGGGTALFTGSLEKGLMAGLGAFGGAGLGTALGAAGATAPAVTGTTQGLAAQGAAGLQTAASAAPTGFQAALPGLGVQTGASTAGASLAPAGSAAALQTAAAGAPQGFAANLSQMGTGLSNVVQGTPGARQAFMQSVGGPMGLATKVGPTALSMFSAEEPDEGDKKPQEYIRPYGFDFKPSAETDPNFRFRTGEKGESTAEQRYFTPTFTPMGVFKGGTEPGPSFYGTPTAEQVALYSRPKDQNVLGLAAGGVAGLGKGGLKDGAFVVPADVVSHLGNGSNDAGQKLLARGLGARPIKGKGDGMSDSIPTSIEGRQPARVADGEAYIPPEVVKKVGAKRLYNMMAKIRQARTGTKKQAPEVNPREFMPA